MRPIRPSTWARTSACIGRPIAARTGSASELAFRLRESPTFSSPRTAACFARRPTGVKGDGDYDRNQQIDFRDLAALASRLGTNPSTGGQPFYDWRSDLVGESSSIDESDLAALLAAFGGHP